MKRTILAILVLTSLFLFTGNVYAQTTEEVMRTGEQYLDNGMYDEAIAEFTKLIQMDPGNGGGYIERGYAYIGKGADDLAFADFNKAIELNPGYPEAYNNRAIIYYKRQDYDNAWKDIHKVQELTTREINPDFLEALKKASGREK